MKQQAKDTNLSLYVKGLTSVIESTTQIGAYLNSILC